VEATAKRPLTIRTLLPTWRAESVRDLLIAEFFFAAQESEWRLLRISLLEYELLPVTMNSPQK
jgi:hypothetical protein